ncbi:hypothetical protein [Spirillospora sp. NPDC048819]|uniref:hypothetical protein n=1 Tax=Spirillospora sp. NPDC048819 TaxID=3155268 RepID=UPI0033F6E109
MPSRSSDASPTLVIRTSTASRVQAVIGVAIFIPFILVPVTGAEGLTGFLIAAPCVLALVITALTHMFRYRLVVTGTAVEQTRWFGRARWIERDRIARIVDARIDTGNGSTKLVFLVDAEGRRLLRLPGHSVRDGQLDQVVQLLGKPVRRPSGHSLSAKKFDKQHPGLVGWHERHPVLTAVLGVTVLVALATLYAIKTTA